MISTCVSRYGACEELCLVTSILWCTLQYFGYEFVDRLPTLEGKPVDEAVANVKESIMPVLKANWMLWPLAQVGGLGHQIPTCNPSTT